MAASRADSADFVKSEAHLRQVFFASGSVTPHNSRASLNFSSEREYRVTVRCFWPLFGGGALGSGISFASMQKAQNSTNLARSSTL